MMLVVNWSASTRQRAAEALVNAADDLKVDAERFALDHRRRLYVHFSGRAKQLAEQLVKERSREPLEIEAHDYDDMMLLLRLDLDNLKHLQTRAQTLDDNKFWVRLIVDLEDIIRLTSDAPLYARVETSA
jgi:hypothetical protein